MDFLNSFEIVIVGCGLSGAVLAERFAASDKKVLIIEKRDHIGGNCYDYYNEKGILVSKYGPHIFHTNDEEVWSYVNKFAEWKKFELKVKAFVDGLLVPIPVNITTVNMLLNANVKNEIEMNLWLEKNQIRKKKITNGEIAAKARVGNFLYEKIFKNYTRKQWEKEPSELDPSVLNRIPVRNNFDDRYFTDKYQGIPKEGYTEFIKKMVSHKNITIVLNADFLVLKNKLKTFKKLFYTGPIDRFFEYKYENKKLEYRSLYFEHETLKKKFFQKNAVINYPNEKEFTRIVEYKHITNQEHQYTTIVREYPRSIGEPYYPVPNPKNRKIYKIYQEEAQKLQNIYFVGRLANYKYFNMDEAIKNALDVFKNHV